MRELTVVEVRLDEDEGSPVLILAEVEGDRQLAIWMSAAGAAGILAALQEADPDHPSSHELMLRWCTPWAARCRWRTSWATKRESSTPS